MLPVAFCLHYLRSLLIRIRQACAGQTENFFSHSEQLTDLFVQCERVCLPASAVSGCHGEPALL